MKGESGRDQVPDPRVAADAVNEDDGRTRALDAMENQGQTPIILLFMHLLEK
jgi:hypothetical protein